MTMGTRKGQQPQTYCVRIAYQAAYPDPWSMKAGDPLGVGHKESEWAGWLWCTDEQGQCRWIPERYLEREGDVAIARRAYHATELSVGEGEMVTGGEKESDWIWCQNETGCSGWVPLENLAHTSYELEA
jgi:uncharacterized protein YgiM (DUF1202 family)